MTRAGSRASFVVSAAVAVLFASAAFASAAAPPGAPATSAPAPPAVRGVSSTTITVGGLGHVARYGAADVGAKARFTRANAEGGVNGRTFSYVGMRDDTGVGATGAQAATTLVDQDGVFAIVPVVTPDLGAAADLAGRQVPYFGWAISSNFCGNEWGFSFTGCTFPPGGKTTSNAWGSLVKQAFGAQSTGRTAAVVTESTESGAYFLSSTTAAVNSAGIRVVSSTSPLPIPAVADYGAIAQQLLAANAGAPPDAIFVMASYANVAQLRLALRGAGYAGLFTDTVEYEPDLVAATTGALVFTPTAAVETASANPAMAQLVADVNAVAPGFPVDKATMAGYWSADLFIAAVKRAGPRLTAERLVKKVNAGFKYAVPATVGPVKFPAAHAMPAPCGTLVQSTGTVYTVAAPYRCAKVVPVGG